MCVTDPNCFNLGLFFVRTPKYVDTYCTCLRYYITSTTSSARNSQAAQDLQWIIEAKKAHALARPDHFEDVTTPSATPNMQQVPRVQTPNMPRVPRVQTPPSVPATHTDDNKRITRSIIAQPSVLRLHSNVTPTCWKSLVLPARPYSNASINRAGMPNRSSK